MSFSTKVKEELEEIPFEKEHCVDAFQYALLCVREGLLKIDRSFVQRSCCKKAFLRGLFLSVGSVQDPEKGYHLELVFDVKEIALEVKSILMGFSIKAKMIQRKNHMVLYLKEGDAIVHFLALIGANGIVLDLENIRAMKDFRNSINRRVNCETANLSKTVAAGLSQVQDIQFIEEHMGLENLSKSLREVAELRLKYPQASLSELSELSENRIGKSGINHRLRKLHEIAEGEKL